MKRLITLLLAITLTFSLVACSSKSEAAKNVELLIKGIGTVTVDSKQAIADAEEAYAALTEEEKSEIKNHDILVKAREEYHKQILIGEWIVVGHFNDTNGPSTITFNADNTFAVSGGATGTYRVSGNKVELGVAEMGLSVAANLYEQEGIDYLDNQGAKYVKSEYATYSEIAITTENWQEYFDVKEITHIEKNGFGEARQISYSHQLEIKDEYRNRIVNMYSENKVVAVEVTYKDTIKTVSLNESGKLITTPMWEYSNVTKVTDICGWDLIENNNNYEDGFSYNRAIAYGSSFDDNGTMRMWFPENVTVNRVGGVLLLYDYPIAG